MIKVAAAVIEKDGRYLVCRRGEGGNCAFLWEFPGGKIEEGETPSEALLRELREELSVKAEALSLLCEYEYSYPERDIYFYFIRARLLSEKIFPTFHTEMKWLLPAELDSVEYCPADIRAVKILKGE